MRPPGQLALIQFLGIFAMAACVFPRTTCAQNANPQAIRVATKEVFVPILVVDRKRVAELQKMDFLEFGQKLVAGSLDFASVAVRGLDAKDFRIFEDGQQQKIENVTPEFHLDRPVSDSQGESEAFVGAGGGIWIAPGVFADFANSTKLDVPEWPGYLITFVPSRPPDRRCHQVAVKVDRPRVLVLARTEYCNAADPLAGTQLGEQMQSELASGKKGKIGLSLAAVDFFAGSQGSRVQISVEFSPNLIFRTGDACYGLPEIHILGLVYTRDGSLAARFSDFTSRSFSPRELAMPLLLPTSGGPVSCSSPGPIYETQINLAPGEYVLRVALRDGKESGQAETRFAVGSSAGGLAVSGIALIRRYRQVPAESPQMPTELPVNYTPLVSRGLDLTPAADNTFQRSDPLYYYLEVFEPPSTQPPPLAVQAHLRIVDAESGAVKKDFPPFSATPFTKAGDPVIPIGDGMDVSDLPRGLYRLEVQATDSAGRSTAWRGTTFALQ